MEIKEFIEHMNSGMHVTAGTKLHDCMCELAAKAQKITSEINCGYRTQKELRELFSRLIGKEVDENFRLFPPVYSDCGKNITVGKGVFINSCCCFQDQGGITIGDGTLIGHNVVFATLNHSFKPSKRGDIRPKSIVIGKRVWIGAHATIFKGCELFFMNKRFDKMSCGDGIGIGCVYLK